jgi:hypothetical protein
VCVCVHVCVCGERIVCVWREKCVCGEACVCGEEHVSVWCCHLVVVLRCAGVSACHTPGDDSTRTLQPLGCNPAASQPPPPPARTQPSSSPLAACWRPTPLPRSPTAVMHAGTAHPAGCCCAAAASCQRLWDQRVVLRWQCVSEGRRTADGGRRRAACVLKRRCCTAVDAASCSSARTCSCLCWLRASIMPPCACRSEPLQVTAAATSSPAEGCKSAAVAAAAPKSASVRCSNILACGRAALVVVAPAISRN